MSYLFFSTSSGTFSYNTVKSSSAQLLKDDIENALLSFDTVNNRLFLYTDGEFTIHKLDGSNLITVPIDNVEFFTVDGLNTLIYYHNSLNDMIEVYNYNTQIGSTVPGSFSSVKDLGIDQTNGYRLIIISFICISNLYV